MRNGTTAKLDEWLAALESTKRKPGDGEGFTSAELARKLGVSQDVAQVRIRGMFRAGLIELCGRRTFTRIDGVPALAPAYRLRPKPLRGR